MREAELARELGVELIVTDHHTIGWTLPQADAIVHPRLPGGHPAGADLCGAAVAFKLAWQVCKSFGDGKRASPHLRDFLVGSLGLVALATIADMVPLSDENRVMVRHGLAGIAAGPECRAPGTDGSERVAGQETADDRDDRLWARAPDQRGGATRTGDDGRRDAHDRRSAHVQTRSRCCSIVATSGARKSNDRSLTRPRRCSRPRAAWAIGGRSCWDARAGTPG